MGDFQLAQILGIVKNVKRLNKDEGSIITVTSNSTQKDYYIHCPFFCPAKRGDVLSGYCVHQPDGRFEFIQCPNVEPSSSKEAVQTAFIIGLGKLKMSRRLSDKLYHFFEQEAQQKIKLYDVKKFQQDKGSPESTIYRNRDSLNAAVMETISWYAFNFRTNESIAEPLINLGLSKEQAHKLLRWWYREFSLRRLYLLGLTKTEIRDCCNRGWVGTSGFSNSPDALYYQLLENPFIPEKVPLVKAQNIAQRYGLSFSQNIIECADLVRFVDKQTIDNGWACYPIFTLMKRYPRFCELEETLKNNFRCTIRYNFLYLRYQADVEDKLVEFLQPSPLRPTHASKETKERLCEEQIAAVESALNNTVSIITGGAGCGKTTVISAIAHELELRDIPYCIASFTGKAVARIKEVVQRRENILTLHMILNRSKLLDMFKRPIEVLIIDEISMVPNELLAKVLAKLHYTLMDRNGKVLRVVVVGDPNQVQPIEWGDFFNQVLTSRIFKEGETQGQLVIPCVQLTEDHRRKEKGVLFSNMAQFATAESPDEIVFEWGKDCQFVEGGIDQIESIIRSIYMMGIPHEEITVISPVNQGLEEINTRCQNVFLNKDTVSIRDSFGKLWKLGARVMMTVNRYDINVMNGEEGIIIGILANRSCVKVRFKNGQEVDFPTFIPVIKIDDSDESDESDEKSLDDQPLSTKLLTLSWAITVHKSQGSQWRYVIFYIPHNISKGGFFNRNLLYTGISRAQEMLYVVANHESVFLSSIFVNPLQRYDNLSKRLSDKPFVDRYVNQNSLKQQELMREVFSNLKLGN
jgi:hypothetical protein